MKNSKSLRVRATAIVLSAICAVSCLSAVSVSANCSEENDNVQIIDQFRDLTFLNRNNDFEVIKSVSGVNASGDNCRCVKNWTDDDSTGEVEGSASSRSFVLNFGDDDDIDYDATDIQAINDGQWSKNNAQWSVNNDQWYSLDGRKLNVLPTRKGIYIKNGKKFVIK